MTKYMILYSSAMSAASVMANTSPEQLKASQNEWIAWSEQARQAVEFDFGLPLQPVAGLDSAGLRDSTSKVSGYSIVGADSKDAVVDAVKNHPHLKQEGGSIDVLEMLPMPGAGS